MLKLYNSLTKKKELFMPINPREVSMYVCGITPYDTTHLGHAFTYVSFDILLRTLRHEGFKVNYTQNITDMNDRDNDILKRAKEKNITWEKLANLWTDKFLWNMSMLNWIKPNNIIKASENIGEMINLINKLLGNGYAYKKNGGVYFDISKKSDFGKLSGMSNADMLKNAKDFEEDIENPEKKSPFDITLWKATSKNQPSHIPSFESPFGQGRPGWHIECSSIAVSALGDQIDIHGGGIDLIYPHHEAEIAQSEGASLKIPFAKYWIHTYPVSYKGSKMSKSLGNLIMVSDLLKKYSPNEIRWYLISHHYREPFEFLEKDLEKSHVDFSKISEYINSQKTDIKVNKNIFHKFIIVLENDLDTPLALKVIKQIARKRGSVLTLKKCLSLLGFSIKNA